MLVRPIQILLVEDNPADIFLTEEAFSGMRYDIRLHSARDGMEALEWLRDPQNVRPDVILLDLNMPRMSGLELLNVLKADASLLDIPVIVLTTSRADEDVWRSYNLHANAYIPKPLSIAEFSEVVRSFETFWFSVASLPRRRGG